MNAVILIPARYQSSRYPGKPLAELKGATGTPKPLIQRSVEAARRVRGVSGLRVVDASLFPCVPCANTNFPTLMTAEKISDMMLAGA